MTVKAILTSDWHLWHEAPVARSTEPDWWAVQAHALEQLVSLCGEHDAALVIAGDLFDRWYGSAELINFVYDNVPLDANGGALAIPGQHDLPNHSLAQVDRSSYSSLARMRVFHDLATANARRNKGVRYLGFPWDTEIVGTPHNDMLNVAVIHAFIWKGNKTHPKAPPATHVSYWEEKLKPFDVAVFGDNHQGFVSKSGDCRMINCGTLIRRHRNERQYEPMVGLLHGDGKIVPHFLDPFPNEKWLDDELLEPLQEHPELDGLLDSLDSLDSSIIDYRAAVRDWIRENESKISGRTKTILLELL